jgi:hypothetical protein
VQYDSVAYDVKLRANTPRATRGKVTLIDEGARREGYTYSFDDESSRDGHEFLRCTAKKRSVFVFQKKKKSLYQRTVFSELDKVRHFYSVA